MHASFKQQAGISLIEALVALAVMAFGMLGVVGLQAIMRQNADVSKQRSEAVRIAQEEIEKVRAFSVLTAPVVAESEPIPVAYEALDDASVVGQLDYTTNTSFTVTRTVVPAESLRMKSVIVTVDWTDRMDKPQRVQLSTNLAGIAPESAGSLSVPPAFGKVLRQALGRSTSIPVAAVDASDKLTSSFSPAAGITWVFNNSSGLITSICNPALVCTPTSALLLSGFVRFAASATTAEAETPTGSAVAVDLQVITTSPSVATIACYSQAQSGHVAYYCAMPVVATSTPTMTWSGKLDLVSSAGFPIATALADTANTHFKVCRYTPVQSDTPPRGNVDHPLTYSNVAIALTQQNFLAIPAGNGISAFSCPGDEAGTPFINGNTWAHQPVL